MLAVFRVHGELLCELKRLMQRMAPDTTLCTLVFRIPLLLVGIRLLVSEKTFMVKTTLGTVHFPTSHNKQQRKNICHVYPQT